MTPLSGSWGFYGSPGKVLKIINYALHYIHTVFVMDVDEKHKAKRQMHQRCPFCHIKTTT